MDTVDGPITDEFLTELGFKENAGIRWGDDILIGRLKKARMWLTLTNCENVTGEWQLNFYIFYSCKNGLFTIYPNLTSQRAITKYLGIKFNNYIASYPTKTEAQLMMSKDFIKSLFVRE